MEKRAHQYKLALEYIRDNKGNEMHVAPVLLEFENHDDIFSIIQMQQARHLFNDPEQSTAFALGLKLFVEVMLKNKNNPLFNELMPAFGAFMKRLKSL